MSLLQINMFCSKPERFKFSQLIYSEINKSQQKSNVILYIHVDTNWILNQWEMFFSEHRPDFKVGIVVHSNANYLNKVYSAHKTSCEYSCKLDDDTLVSSHVWDFIIENLHYITKETPVIAPILTNGIPSVEFFIEDFLDKEQKKNAFNLLLSGRINPNEWGLDYSAINNKIETMSQWCGREYWDFVKSVDTKWEERPVPWHYYHVRGVHPARYSEEYNMYVAKCIMENKVKFFNKQDYYFDKYDAPYFTNNMFVSTTEYWKKTLPLFDDGFDEGQLTLQKDIDKSDILYIRNGYGIHMAYGMTANQQKIQQYYTDNL